MNLPTTTHHFVFMILHECCTGRDQPGNKKCRVHAEKDCPRAGPHAEKESTLKANKKACSDIIGH